MSVVSRSIPNRAPITTEATIFIYQQRSGWQSQETRATPSVAA